MVENDRSTEKMLPWNMRTLMHDTNPQLYRVNDGCSFWYQKQTGIGTFGFSASGFDSARAIFLHPDFYKITVSASGNHDHNVRCNSLTV